MIKIFKNIFSSKNFNASYPIALSLLSIIFICIISFYPLFFFDKSFDSPHQQNLLSSPGSLNPPVPGAANTHTNYYDWWMGSDTGAFSWATGPNLIAAIKSISKDNEFPFYNKFVGGGIANFAQNNNQVLDPLNLFIYFFDGNSWGFDLKIFASRLVFLFGIFLIALNITKSKINSIIVTISALFIGFFHFRINHPAVFTLTYAPLLLYFWLDLNNYIFKECKKKWNVIFAITIFSFLLINSSPIKESSITLLMITLYGFVNILAFNKFKHHFTKKNCLIIFSVGIFLFFSTFFNFVLFLDNLSKNFSQYDFPHVYQLNLAYLLGFFQKTLLPNQNGASTNLFFFFILVVVITKFRYFFKDRNFSIIFFFFILNLSIVYEIFPSSILILIPFINNIGDVSRVFSIPAFIFLIVIASMVINFYRTIKIDDSKKIIRNMFLIYLFLGLLFVHYEIDNLKIHSNATIILFLTASCLLFTVFLKKKKFINFSLIFLFSCQMFTNMYHIKYNPGTIRFSEWIPDTIRFNIANKNPYLSNIVALAELRLDELTTQLTQRGDYSKLSPAIKFLLEKQKDEPFRVIGFRDNYPSTVLWPGFNTRYGLESVLPVDAIRNPNFEKFLILGNLNNADGWGWLRLLTEENIGLANNLLNKLNVKYVITNVYVVLDRKDYELVHSSDYKVWLNKKYWPRAYSTNKVDKYNNDIELENIINSNSTPHVFIGQTSKRVDPTNNNTIIKNNYGSNYKATNNKLSFNININANDILVINQNYYPEDYRLYLNNKECNYFKLNLYQIGCKVYKTGNYSVNLVYKPKYSFISALITFGYFCIFLAMLIIMRFRVEK